MSILPAWVIYAYNKAAGFPDPVTATAIVLAESGGQTDVHGPQQYYDKRQGRWIHIDPVGIWQIETVSHGVSAANASDPQWATRFAAQLSHQGADFTPWEAYTAGTYQQFLPAARAAAATYDALGGVTGGGRTGGAPPPIDNIGGVFSGAAGDVGGFVQDPSGTIGRTIIGNVPGAGIVSDIWDSLRSGNLTLRAGLVVLGFAGVLMGAYIAFSGGETPDLSQLTDALKGGGKGKAGEAAGGEAAEAAVVA